jgi:small subunit ribosomal protein S2
MATVDVDIKQLLAAGAHFGHKTSRWHPRMAEYIHSKRGGSHIIDLTYTVAKMEHALDFIADTVGQGKQILLVSTKRQTQDIVKELAESVNQPYVTERWLGGMLTNYPTISGRVKRLKDLEEKMANGELANKYSKLEVQRFQEEIDAMNILYGGIKNMAAKVGVVFVFDIVADLNAVKEARKLGLPIVALVDTNADPTLVTYPIPCNDDAIKTVQLVTEYLKKAIEVGKAKAAKAAPAVDKTESDKPEEKSKGE